jgi:multiple sugar transport system ATP-binding protein
VGKSTLLNTIAGLEAPTSGSIKLNGRPLNAVHPKDRDIAMVFQSYALYPAMTVRGNIAFGLEIKGMAKAARNRAVEEVAELPKISELLDRKPSQLSGGQRQRVAMARALVKDPLLFLFDEPLSNLDAKLRISMRTEIKKLHRRLGRTMIYVTHDQVEAMTLADRIVLLNGGVLQQVDTPQVIYDRPANTFVAGFIGSPAMNLLPGTLQNSTVRLDGLTAFSVPVPPELTKVWQNENRRVLVGLRPENITLDYGSAQNGSSVIMPISITEPTGADTMVFFNLGSTEVVARVDPSTAPRAGNNGVFKLDTSRMLLFDEATGRLMAP